MSHKEKLIDGLQKVMHILQPPDENKTSQSQAATNSGAISEESKKEIIDILQRLLTDAKKLPDTDTQAEKKYFRLPRLFSSSKKVQVYTAVDTPKDFDGSLMKLCTEMSYKCEMRKKGYVLQHDAPVIVVCPITSRLEPDIDHALNGLEWQKPYIALVVHQGNEYSLPKLPTATRLSSKPKYKNANFVDVAFSEESKLYPCEMNENAKLKVKEFIDAFYN